MEQDKITVRRAVSRQCDIFFFSKFASSGESSGDCEVWSLLLKKVLGFVLEPCRGLELPGGEGPFQILF